MSFDLVHNGIANLLKTQGLQESEEAVNYTNAPPNTYNLSFILKPLSGELADDVSETCVDRLDDRQEWQIQIAFERSAQTDFVNLGRLHRLKDTLIPIFDKPASWTSFVKILKYTKWAVTEAPNYFILDMRILLRDTYIHS